MTQHPDAMTGKVALITGAARGIGAETAKALAARGARLVLTDLDQEPLDEVVRAVGPDNAIGVVADVCDLSSMESAVAQGVERFGGIDLVLANAGIASYGSVLSVDPATFRRVIDVNINGAFHTVRAALPSVIERKGYILIVSSLAAFAPAPGFTAYNASKAGVEHLANALHLELHHHGVDVGCAHMSWIDTPLVQDAKRDSSGFRELLDRLPPPLNRTTDVQSCVDGFVKGLENRSRRVFVPGWVGHVHRLRTLVTTRLGESTTLRHAPRILAKMDEDVARLGRSTSARNIATDNAASQ
jgi:NAD(P)-dependent dehydrogenase (short-subunit alcohol dehydrogenase family)